MIATRPYPFKRVLLAILGALTLLSCCAMPHHFKAKESALWPQAKGVITTSRLEVGSYDPKNPGFAVLEPGLHGEMHDTFVLAIIYIVFFVAAFLWVLFST